MSLKHTFSAFSRRFMPRRLREMIFHFGFNIAPEEFELFAHRYAYAPNMRLGLAAARDRGFEVDSVVDVGAFEGQWSRMTKGLFPNAKLAMIEPNRTQAETLAHVARELDAQVYDGLLGAEDGTRVTYHVMKSGSSIYEERSGVSRTSEDRETVRLDTLLEHWASIGLLKIDTEGYELEILKGAERLLPVTASVLLEVSLIQTNRGAPLLPQVVEFMRSNDFVPYDILEFHRRPIDRALNKIDILFLRENSPLLQDRRHS